MHTRPIPRFGWLVTLLLSLASCSTPLPRAEINKFLHELADDYETRDPARVLRHFTPQCDAIEAELAVTFARVAHLPKTKIVLDGIRAIEGGFEVQAFFMFYGFEMDHNPVQARRHLVYEVEPVADELGKVVSWKIRKQRTVADSTLHGDGITFVECAAAVGLSMTHTRHHKIAASTPVVPGNFSGAGVSCADLDGDGFLDLLVGDGAQVRLFHNLANGKFEDITRAAGLIGIDKVRGAYFFDFNGDGRDDLLFTRAGEPPQVCLATGEMRFVVDPSALSFLPSGQYESAAFGDLDGDGDLDIFLVRYGDFYRQSWAYPVYQSSDGVADVVLENLGQGRFRQVENSTLTPVGWGLAVALADYDNDNDLDIYIVNDFGSNHLIRNDGDWQFTDVTQAAGVSDQGFGMSSAFGDYDGDGLLDIYVANMNSSSRWVFEDPDYPLPFLADLFFMRGHIKQQMHTVTRGNSLFRNRGDGTFEQMATRSGAERAQWAWGANFCDFDNDGDLDVYSPNGFITGSREPDR